MLRDQDVSSEWSMSVNNATTHGLRTMATKIAATRKLCIWKILQSAGRIAALLSYRGFIGKSIFGHCTSVL
jgi:hypothetical protein